MPVNKDERFVLRSFLGKLSLLIWDQPVLLLLQSEWRVLKLVWSLRCPLLLGVGSAWHRRTGDVLVNLSTVLFTTTITKGLIAMNDFIVDIGRRWLQGWEWIHDQCRIKPGQRRLTFLCLFFYEMKCRVWCILHMFLWKVNIRTFCIRLFILLSAPFLRLWFQNNNNKKRKHLKWLQRCEHIWFFTVVRLNGVLHTETTCKIKTWPRGPRGDDCHWQLRVNFHRSIKW